MVTKEFISEIIDYVQNNANKLEFNKNIFEIMEGDLLAHLVRTLQQQLSGESAKVASQRAAPINVWNKIVKKLSKLYAKPVIRTTENPSDQELIDYYSNKGLNKHMGNFNENYNSYKWSGIEIYEDELVRELRFRSIPSHQFIVYSDDKVDPLRPTALIKVMGEFKDVMGVTRKKYWIYTKDEFIAILDNGDLVHEDMAENEGVNPFGVIPFQYESMSDYLLVPMPDQDTLQMTLLIGVLLSDINYGSMFLSFPLIYTQDMDAENMPASPNHFLNLKSEDSQSPGSIGVVKAEPDLGAQMDHVIRQLDLWLDSRDINAQGLGSLTAENFASGVSKIISEMDTIENRKQQEQVFRDVEVKFWKRLAQIHNTLALVGRLENRQLFSDPKTLHVSIQYAEEVVFESRMDKIARLKAEKDSGFTSKRKAIKELNDDMEDAQIEELIAEIEEERSSVIEVTEEDEDGKDNEA